MNLKSEFSNHLFQFKKVTKFNNWIDETPLDNELKEQLKICRTDYQKTELLNASCVGAIKEGKTHSSNPLRLFLLISC